MRRIVDFVSGFATETTLALVRAAVDAINAKIPASPATTGKQDTGNTSLASIDGKITECDTGAVTVTTCALPTGAATLAAQGTGNASLASIDGKVTACNTGAVTVASSALPTGAATSALQGAGLPAALGAGGGVKIDGSGTALPVSGSVTAAQGTAAAAGAPWFVRLSDGASAIAVALDATVAAMSAKLPAALGQAARASSLSVGLSTEDAAKVPSLGQALAASSVPVVLTAIQIAQLAQTGQLPAALGTLASSGAVCVVRSVPSIDKQTTLATAGKVIKSAPGVCYGLTSYFNNTGGAIFFQIFNAIAAPSAGDRPDYFSASIANGTKSSLGFGITALGIGCPTGIVFVASSTQDTFTAIASTAVIYALQYD